MSRVVIKIGSSSLTDPASGGLNRLALDGYVDTIVSAKKRGIECVLVTSGAVASGYAALGYRSKPKAVRMKQAAAAVGQGLLMHAYANSFGRYGTVVGQVLLTRAELSAKEAFDNAFNTLEELLANNAVPIINENDSVATDELRFGDNDILSAYVAGLVHSDLLVIITDTDGIYESDPRKNPKAKRIEKLESVSDAIISLTSGAGSSVGTGGMRAKVIAARQAMAFGVPVFIGRTAGGDGISEIMAGSGPGTYIGSPEAGGVSKKLQWIGLHGKAGGIVEIDDGAAQALSRHRKSLLPAGVVGVIGTFSAGELLQVIRRSDGAEIARGISNYSSTQLLKAAGKDTNTSGDDDRPRRPEVVHRDELVVTELGEASSDGSN